MKQMLIPEELLAQLCRYHLLDERGEELEKAIHDGLQKKLEAFMRRGDYTKKLQQERGF